MIYMVHQHMIGLLFILQVSSTSEMNGHLHSKEIYDYSLNKYGNDLNQIKYYVNNRGKRFSGKIISSKR